MYTNSFSDFGTHVLTLVITSKADEIDTFVMEMEIEVEVGGCPFEEEESALTLTYTLGMPEMKVPFSTEIVDSCWNAEFDVEDLDSSLFDWDSDDAT